ncbi:hypothetical protein [Cognatishimia sp. F0-27]|uniref:hypothetical protein n=1 Tax=Cognatishimia sp. F0-27 TaxID=2816855 RepID=UPI001D0C902F|nr:hypothetical protein [Cognatishimia sp. F0-27]MCC1491552.1 hypothetical protein [Cognatishimia sp. F0-27]
MKFLKEGAAFATGLVAMAVSGTVLFDWATNTSIKTIDDVVASLNGIAEAVSQSEFDSASDQELEESLAALGAVSQALVEAAPNSGESGSYLRVFSGVFDLPPGSAVDLDAPDGSFASLGFHRFKRGSETWAGTYFNGKEVGLLPGQILEFPEEDPVCQVMYVGPVDDALSGARFRFRCRS